MTQLSTITETKIVLIAVALIIASGCSRQSAPVFGPVDPPLVWPAAPDPTRISYLGKLANTDDLHPADSGWTKFKQALTGKKDNWHRLVSPKCVAVYRDRVYVSDTGRGDIVVFDMNTRRTKAMTAPSGKTRFMPACLALSETRLFVSDASTNSIDVFDHDGKYLASWNSPQLSRPAGLCWCPTHRQLYVVDIGNHRVIRFDEQGHAVGTFGSRGTGPGEFNFPLYITCDEKLGLLITDALNTRVQRFSLGGEFISSFGHEGDAAGSFARPKGLACDTDGHIYVVDSNFENVQIFDPQGQLLLSFGGEGRSAGQFSLPDGIAIDSQDRIWVADAYNQRVQVFQYHKAKGEPQ